MHLNRVLHRSVTTFVCLCILFSVFFVYNISADDEPDSLVDASFNIEFVTGTDLLVDVTMDVYKLTTYKVYDADAIKNAVEQDMGALRYALFLLLKNQLEAVFENANISNFEMPAFNGENFNETLVVKLTPTFFKLNASVNSENLINGVLDMGAVINYNFNLQAEPGWNNTFTYALSDVMNLDKANTTDVDLYKNEVSWTLKNWNGENPNRLAALSTRFKYPTTTALEIEDIRLELELDITNVNNITLKTNIIAKNIDIRDYDILPDFITELDFVPSDGIRLFIDNMLLSWDGFYLNTIKPVEQNTISTIENSSFNQTLEMSFSWASETSINCSTPFNITSMDGMPPIKAELLGEDVYLSICNMSSRAFFGLVNGGAMANISAEDINFGDRLDEIGRAYEVFLHLPNNITLEGKNVYNWNQSAPLSGKFESDLQPKPEYSKENIDTLIEIDISKMDLNIGSFFTGKTELTATSYVKEGDYIYVMFFPQEFNMSKKINLTYLNSDAFRLCIEESVFNEEAVDFYLKKKKFVFEERLYNVLNDLKIKGVVDKDGFSESLTWDGDISNMDGVAPVVVSNYAHEIYPVAFSLSLWPPEISISNQSFYLEGLENQSVTYRIIFPKGISVKAKDDLNKSIIKGKTNDGREYVELLFAFDEDIGTDVVLCELYASPLYLLGLFLPCILSLVLVVILIIVVYLIRKKRRGRKIPALDKTESALYRNS